MLNRLCVRGGMTTVSAQQTSAVSGCWAAGCSILMSHSDVLMNRWPDSSRVNENGINVSKKSVPRTMSYCESGMMYRDILGKYVPDTCKDATNFMVARIVLSDNVRTTIGGSAGMMCARVRFTACAPIIATVLPESRRQLNCCVPMWTGNEQLHPRVCVLAIIPDCVCH